MSGHTIVLYINEQATRIGHSQDVPGRPEGPLEQSVGSKRHSSTAALSSSIEFGVNTVTTMYYRGHAVEMNVKATVRVSVRGIL